LDDYLGIYKRGSYVRIDIKGIKFKHFNKFSTSQPIVICRINPGEDNFGFIKIRIKKHRWYNNLLKSKDPLIVSLGWRRFQTLPIFITKDLDLRLRYLKYTPQHDFCYAILYGNFAP